MKITEQDVIKNGEQELIDAITADLDWGAIDRVFRKEHKLQIDENVEYKKGDIVVYNDRVAYQLDFDVKVILSVFLDREGNYISITSSGDLNELKDKAANDLSDENEKSEPKLEDGYEDVLSEPKAKAAPDIDEMSPISLNPEKPQKKISEISSQAGAMIPEIKDEPIEGK